MVDSELRSEGDRVGRARAVVIAATTALLLGACGGDDEPTGLSTESVAPTTAAAPEPSPTPTAPATTAAPPADPTSDDAILADYTASRDAYIAAYNPADPENPGLLEWFDGNALQGYQSELEGLVAEGRSEVIDYDLHPEVDLREGDSVAIVKDCYTVLVTTIDTESGDQVGPTRTYTRHTNFTLSLRDGTWITVNYHHLESECTPGG